MKPLRYTRRLLAYATHEELEAAICGHLEEFGGCARVYASKPREKVVYVDANTCRERFVLADLTAGFDPAGAASFCRIDIKTLFVPEEELLALTYVRDWLGTGFVTITCGGQTAHAVEPVFVSVRVDEEWHGPLPEGEDPLKVFTSLKKRLLSTKCKGQFYGWGKNKPLRDYHWTEGVRQLYENGTRLYDHKEEIRVVSV